MKVFIENARGSSERTRYDENTLEFKESFPAGFAYPYPYGFIMGTNIGREDCVDCYVITERELEPGAAVECEVAAMIEMVEDGEVDHKVLAVLPGDERADLQAACDAIKAFLQRVFSRFEDVHVRLGDLLPRERALEFVLPALSGGGLMDGCRFDMCDARNRGDLLGLLESFAREFVSEDRAGSVRREYEAYLADRDDLVSLLLYKGGSPIGCAQMFVLRHPPMLDADSFEECELMNFYVVPSERGRGYGQRILARFFEEARRRRIRHVYLNGSPEAERLYERNGFKDPAFRYMGKWCHWDPRSAAKR